jgi:hypothetical protein
MPHPSEVHTDSALSKFISGYTNGEFFADVVSPIIETEKRSDVYQKFSRKDVASYGDDLIGPTAEANRLDYSISTGSYTVKDRGRKAIISMSEIANADEPHKPREKHAMHCMNWLLLGREVRVATALNLNSNFASGNYSTVSNYWTDEVNGTPLTDLQTARAAIAPGMYGNSRIVAVMALEVWHSLRKHPQMLGGGSTSAVLTREACADLIGVDEIFISDAQKNTANQGQTASFSRVWSSTKALLIRVPNGEPSGEAGLFAATFRFAGDGGDPVRVRRWDEPRLGTGGSEAVQVEFSDDEVVVQNDQAYLLEGVRA